MDIKGFKKNYFVRSSVPAFKRRLLHGRTANFNSIEKRVLVQLIEPYKDVLDSRKNDATTVNEKDNVWNHVTRLFNARFPGQKPRELRNLQRLWKNIKSRAKAQNTDIEAMLDSEPPGLHLQQPIKLENMADEFENGFPEDNGHCSSSTTTDHLSIESKVEKSEVKAAPRAYVPSLNHISQETRARNMHSPVTDSGKISSAASEDSNSFSFAAKSQTDIGAFANASNSNNVREVNGSDASAIAYPNTFDSTGARSDYEDTVLLMKQSEHEQKMKNLKLEREMKQEEHVLRMDVLREEMELVRLRKELLKRQLESYVSVMNA